MSQSDATEIYQGYPLPLGTFYLSHGYPRYNSGGRHRGVDLSTYRVEGITVFSVTDGVVYFTEKNKPENTYHLNDHSYGNCVKIKLVDGTRLIYAHLQTADVDVGQEIKRGQIIGTSGNSGNSSGAHLHFEVNDSSGNHISPYPYLPPDISNVQR
jgi:murein DD-endopeptidase MepM/ murein hydrolase activator NlpD